MLLLYWLLLLHYIIKFFIYVMAEPQLRHKVQTGNAQNLKSNRKSGQKQTTYEQPKQLRTATSDLSPNGKFHLRVKISFDVSKSMWVFGYGSLIWKADFPFKVKLVGYIKGYKRRFYQHSVDHRGRPNKPGRVVTLLPSQPDDSVWGVAYEIYKRDENVVTAHLDYREKTGYKKHKVTFYPTQIIDGHSSDNGDCVLEAKNVKMEPFELMIYIGTEDNDWYAGPASIDAIAKQIFESEGPSGTNKEYLFNLAKAMRAMAPHVNDEHLFTLEKAVMDLEKASKLPNK